MMGISLFFPFSFRLTGQKRASDLANDRQPRNVLLMYMLRKAILSSLFLQEMKPLIDSRREGGIGCTIDEHAFSLKARHVLNRKLYQVPLFYTWESQSVCQEPHPHSTAD